MEEFPRALNQDKTELAFSNFKYGCLASMIHKTSDVLNKCSYSITMKSIKWLLEKLDVHKFELLNFRLTVNSLHYMKEKHGFQKCQNGQDFAWGFARETFFLKMSQS